jgi:hypothetical protein
VDAIGDRRRRWQLARQELQVCAVLDRREPSGDVDRDAGGGRVGASQDRGRRGQAVAAFSQAAHAPVEDLRRLHAAGMIDARRAVHRRPAPRLLIESGHHARAGDLGHRRRDPREHLAHGGARCRPPGGVQLDEAAVAARGRIAGAVAHRRQGDRGDRHGRRRREHDRAAPASPPARPRELGDQRGHRWMSVRRPRC